MSSALNTVSKCVANYWQAEQEKQTKDNQIKTLNAELAKQDENAAKLSKDKKALEETIKKTQADLAAEEDKVNHLNKLKQKLEGTIDEVRVVVFKIDVVCVILQMFDASVYSFVTVLHSLFLHSLNLINVTLLEILPNVQVVLIMMPDKISVERLL